MQKSHNHHDDGIVARQEGDQDAGKHISVEERLRQSPLLTGDIDEARKSGAAPEIAITTMLMTRIGNTNHPCHVGIGADEAHVKAETAEMDAPGGHRGRRQCDQ